MLVAEILEDARECLGFKNETKVFSRLTDAVEALANKGQWDSLLTYLDIKTTGDLDIIGLPPEVDAVLRININGNPAFARGRMYEFTLNGPGSNDPRLGWQWEDLGDVTEIEDIITEEEPPPTSETPIAGGIEQEVAQRPRSNVIPPYFLPRSPVYDAHWPLRVTIYSRDVRHNAVVIYTVDGSDPTWEHGTRGGRTATINITHETTIKAIAAWDRFNVSSIITGFYTEATEPVPPPDPAPPPLPFVVGQRVIRLSQKAVAVRALVRLKPKAISKKEDWICLDSKLAILLMLKANESYRRGTPVDFQLGQGQEAQALKFLQEEQQSRNVDTELAKMLDAPPLIGYTYHTSNLITVQDIYDESSTIVMGVGKPQVLDRISEAVEVLANKGQWDGMTAYLDMSFAEPTSEIGLPRQVEIPIKINIEKQPSIPRNRLFEFSTNGPGTDLTDVNILTWVDQGSTPLMQPLLHPSSISVGGGASDSGKVVTIYGIDTNGIERTVRLEIPSTSTVGPPVSSPVAGGIPTPAGGNPTTFKDITRVVKEETVGPVSVFANYGLMALLYPDETESSYRKVKLNKPVSNIKVMFRKSSLKIKDVTDIIPLKSRQAVLLMLKSLMLLKAPDLSPDKVQMAAALETQALKFMTEEEQSRLAFAAASSRDKLPAFGIQTFSQGVITAAEVFDDASDIFGPIGRPQVFDKITEAMELLSNKSMWDGMDGYVDIVTDQRGYMSLPRKIETITGMNYFRSPATVRNKWYEFHMNGMVTDPVQGDFYDDLGEYPLQIEPSVPMRLFAVTQWENDSSVVVRAYGYDNGGTWIRSLEGDKMVDGEIVPVTFNPTNNQTDTITVPSTSNYFRQVTRVTKNQCDMPVALYGGRLIDTSATAPPGSTVTPPPITALPEPVPELLAFFDADETEPMFRRVRVPTYVTWVRLRYRKRVMKISKMEDVLNMKSKTALVTMMRYMKALETDPAAAQNFEQTAVKIISEEEMSRNPGQTFDLQYDQKTCFADPLQGRY